MTGTQPLDEFHVSLQEIEFREALRLRPPELLKDTIARLPRELRHGMEDQQNCCLAGIAELIALHLGTDPRAKRQFFFELSAQRLWRAFAGLDLAAGKLPLERMRLVWFPAANQDAPAAFDDGRDYRR